jgi:flagellar motor switch protein FliM
MVDFSVELGRTFIRSGDVLRLKAGDVIKLEKDVKDSLFAMVEGVPKFKGRPGTFHGAKAFKVESFL